MESQSQEVSCEISSIFNIYIYTYNNIFIHILTFIVLTAIIYNAKKIKKQNRKYSSILNIT